MLEAAGKGQSIGGRAVRGTGRLVAWIFRFGMKLSLVSLFLALGMFVGGFLQFAHKIANDVLPVDIREADAIVVLTGGSTRIETALELLAQRKGQRLLISGVNISTKKADIQDMHSVQARLFDCCVDLERVAANTVGNAVETAKWVQKQGYKSLIVVTSAYHMPRSLVEFRSAMPDVVLTPYPVPLESINHEGWWKNAKTLRFMLNEYLKYLGARSRRFLRPQTFNVLRSSMWSGKVA